MNYPYFCCERCDDLPIKETELPIDGNQIAPKCPNCGKNDNIDVVLGNESTVIGDEDTIIYKE